MSEWISVKDRLPEEEGFYFVWVPTWERKPDICFYSEETGWFTYDMYDVNLISHWMCLPEPPESDGVKDEQ